MLQNGGNMYTTFSKSYTNEENVSYTGYGILNDKNSILVEDITTDGQRLNSWVKLLNKHALSEVHILEAVEDFLMN